jgi:hypothetical protein
LTCSPPSSAWRSAARRRRARAARAATAGAAAGLALAGALGALALVGAPALARADIDPQVEGDLSDLIDDTG